MPLNLDPREYGFDNANNLAVAVGTLQSEAGNQDLLGRALVADVAANRHAAGPAGGFPYDRYGTYTGIAAQMATPSQFSTWLNGQNRPTAVAYQQHIARIADNPLYYDSLPAATRAQIDTNLQVLRGTLVTGEFRGATGGATFYSTGQRSQYSDRTWAEHVNRGMLDGYRHGGHLFYGRDMHDTQNVVSGALRFDADAALQAFSSRNAESAKADPTSFLASHPFAEPSPLGGVDESIRALYAAGILKGPDEAYRANAAASIGAPRADPTSFLASHPFVEPAPYRGRDEGVLARAAAGFATDYANRAMPSDLAAKGYHGDPSVAPGSLFSPVSPRDMDVGVPYPGLEIERVPGPGGQLYPDDDDAYAIHTVNNVGPSIFGPSPDLRGDVGDKRFSLQYQSSGPFIGHPSFDMPDILANPLAYGITSNIFGPAPGTGRAAFDDAVYSHDPTQIYEDRETEAIAQMSDRGAGQTTMSPEYRDYLQSTTDWDAVAGFSPSSSSTSPPPSQTLLNADAMQRATRERNDIIGQNALARAAAAPSYTANPDWGLDSPKERNLAGVNAARAAGTFGTVPQPAVQPLPSIPAPRFATVPTKGQQYAAALSPSYAQAQAPEAPSLFSANAQTTAHAGGFFSGGGQWVDTDPAKGGSWNHGGGYGYNAPDGSYFAAGGDFIDTPSGPMANYLDAKSGNYSPGELAQAQLAAGVFGPSLFSPAPGFSPDNGGLGAFGDTLADIIAAAAADAFGPGSGPGQAAGYAGGHPDPYGGGGYGNYSGENWRG